MFQSTECFHFYHIQCFVDYAKKIMTSVNQASPVFAFEEPKCAKCIVVVAEWEIKEVLSQEKWAEIEALRMDITTANDPNMVKCSCGNVMYMEQAGTVDYKQKDEKN